MGIVEGVANLCIKYQMYLDDYKQRARDTDEYLKQVKWGLNSLSKRETKLLEVSPRS
jgi:hypothetical protein